MIYLVTVGCYSDYSVQGVFLNEKKARLYAELHGYDVEEFEPMDDEEIIVGRKVSVNYWIANSGIARIKIEKCQIEPSNRNSTVFHFNRVFGSELNIYRYIADNNLSDEQLRNKYEKAAYDIMAYCKERLSSGYNERQINEFLSSKYERGKIE